MGVGRSLLGLPNRQVLHSLENRHLLAAAIRLHQPDWLFVPYPLGARQTPDEIRNRLRGTDDGYDAFERMAWHLSDNKVDLLATKATLGPVLTMDPQTEKFTGPLAAEANKLATREYRQPYVVPENV